MIVLAPLTKAPKKTPRKKAKPNPKKLAWQFERATYTLQVPRRHCKSASRLVILVRRQEGEEEDDAFRWELWDEGHGHYAGVGASENEALRAALKVARRISPFAKRAKAPKRTP
jgi:hypothetical protein